MRKISKTTTNPFIKENEERKVKERLKRNKYILSLLTACLVLITSTVYTLEKAKTTEATTKVESAEATTKVESVYGTAKSLKNSGVDIRIAAKVLKETYKGFSFEANGDNLTIGLYTKKGDVIELETIIFNN